MGTSQRKPKSYAREYARSIADPESFWGEQAEQIAWYEKPEQVLSTDEKGFYRWFKGGQLNTAYLALDYHVENGRAEQHALIYDSPVTGVLRKYTYAELRNLVARFAGALQNLGIGKGDTVVIYMPVIPEAVVAMLACARLGAIHSVVFGGFAPHELSVRIDDAKPKVVISASCGIEFSNVIPYKPLLDKALASSSHQPDHTIILQRPQVQAELQPGRDLDYMELLEQAQPANCVPVDATDPLYILYTSGTTGKPKGIVRDNGGHAVALKYSMKAVYDVDPGDVFWAASDVGWAVGHSYLVYAPLIHGCTSILFEGKPVRTPDAGTFWRIVQEHEVKVLFTAPTAFRAIKKEDPDGHFKKKYGTPSLKYLFLAGERCDPATYYWAKDLLQVPVIDHWWQTESGWPMVATMMGIEPFPAKPGSAGKPVSGYKVHILNEEGQRLIPNQEGIVAVKLPLPPGCLPTLWEDDERFRKSYLERFPGYYMTGDGGYIDEDGYVYIMGRIDDVINVSGHRLSTGEMEEMVSSHPAVAECAVIGIGDELRGQRPVGLVVLKDGQTISEQELEKELVTLVREKIGAVAYFRTVLQVQRLPKTRSGKILRRILRHIADGTPYAVPSTIDDPAILTEIRDRLKSRRIGNAFINLKTLSNQELNLAMTNYQLKSYEEYQEAYKRSTEDPEGFWADIADTFTWRKKWDKVLDWNFDEPNVKWFQGGKMNITENCLDRHLKTRGNKLALIWEPNDPKERFIRYTYRELHEKVCQFANVLKKNGAKKGDRICIYMPMIPELAIAVLACARIGATHSVIFAGFSAVSMADRINDAQATMVLTSDGLNRGAKQIPVKRVVDEALESCPSVERVIVVERLGWAVNMVEGRDVWFHDEVKTVSKDCPAEEMDAEDMLFILYTSGSTGKPKGVVHTCGGYMVYAQYSFMNVFQYQESDIYWCTADIGWVTGHTYLLYGPLLSGATTLMFEGVPTYPDNGRFWQVVDKYGVTIFYTAPTAIRSLMAGDIDDVLSYSLDSLKVLGSVGEPINEEAWHWYHTHVGKERCPVVDTWWQTETGGIMISTLAGVTPMKPSHAALPLPGIQPILVDSDGNEIAENGVEGYLCMKFPWPGMIRTTYGDHERCRLSYFSTYKGLYFTGDGAKRDENGLYRIIGRVDDVINVSGHRFGTAEIEEAINHNEHVVESAVVGYPHDVKGQGIYAFVICKEIPEKEEYLRAEIIETVVEKIGKIAKPDKIQIVSGLPKTRSGKIMRRILRKIAEGETSNLGDTSTLLDPDVVDEIKAGAL